MTKMLGGASALNDTELAGRPLWSGKKLHILNKFEKLRLHVRGIGIWDQDQRDAHFPGRLDGDRPGVGLVPGVVHAVHVDFQLHSVFCQTVQGVLNQILVPGAGFIKITAALVVFSDHI